jgi:hypothetical protein
MPRYDTHAQQFGLVSGIRQPSSDMVLVAEPATLFAPEARKGRLYILVEPSQEAARGRDACQLVMKTIHKVFYEDSSYSITSALRKAIQTANRELYQYNFSAPPQRRACVGISCAVVKDQELYLAQVLPAQAFVLSGGALRAMPGSVGGHEPRSGALGFSLTTEPDLYRASLRAGDALLLCSTAAAALLDRETAARLLRAQPLEAAADQLGALCGDAGVGDAHALAVRLAHALSPAAQAAPLSPGGVAERGRLLARGAGDRLARLTGDLALLVRPGAREQGRRAERRAERTDREQRQLHQPHQDPVPPLPRIPPTPELRLGESVDERVAQERQTRLGRFAAPEPRQPEELPPSAFLGEQPFDTPPADTRIDLSDTPSMAALGGPYGRRDRHDDLPIDMTLGERLTLPFQRAAQAIGRSNERRRMRRPPPSAMRAASRARGLSYRREGTRIHWMLLGLLVALVALLVVYGRVTVQENARREALDALDQAEQAVSAVRSAPNEAAAERQLEAARLAINRVQATGVITASTGAGQRLIQLQREYEQNLATLQKLSYLDDLTEIGRHPQAGAGATFQSIVVPPPPTGITNTLGFSAIYALDTNAGVVYSMPKAGGAIQPFLSPGDSYLPGLRVGKTRAIAWRLDNIVSIAQSDDGPFIYYFRAGDRWNGSNLGGSTEWNRVPDKPFHLVTYAGNLYVWGAVPGQVLKYISGQPADPYDPWIKDDQRKTDASIDIAIDGNIYLLQPDSSVLVYEANRFSRALPAPAVKPPLTVVTSFVVTGDSPESGSIYLLDTNGGRIIELDKRTGKLVQQIRARPDGPVHLTALAALYVDESGPRKQVYLVNEGRILRATLPQPPLPFQEGTPQSAP